LPLYSNKNVGCQPLIFIVQSKTPYLGTNSHVDEGFQFDQPSAIYALFSIAQYVARKRQNIAAGLQPGAMVLQPFLHILPYLSNKIILFPPNTLYDAYFFQMRN